PSNSTVPYEGRSRPESTPKRVLLPAPFGPTRPTTSASGTDRSTLLTAARPPKCTVILEQARRASSPDRAPEAFIAPSPAPSAGAPITVAPASHRIHQWRRWCGRRHHQPRQGDARRPPTRRRALALSPWTQVSTGAGATASRCGAPHPRGGGRP